MADQGAEAGKGAPPASRGGVVKLLGSFFGAGFLPKAPGTWGSIAALAIYVPLRQSGLDKHALGCTLFFLIFSIASLTLGRRAEAVAGQRDPNWFVLDEMAGVFLALFGLAEYNIFFVGAAFLLFRFFDALKIGATAWAEEHFGGTVGIWLDDCVAAAYANLPLRGLAFLLAQQGFEWVKA